MNKIFNPNKLLLQERHDAWNVIARKLAHEIKNPLTPIQLTIDRLKNKYSDIVNTNDKNNFNNHCISFNIWLSGFCHGKKLY